MAFSNIFSRPARLVLSATVFLSLAQAHTVMTTLYVDGENQGDGVCIRMNMDGYTSNYFVSPVTSKDIACGVDGEKGVSRVCPAKTSSVLTFEFREDADDVNSRPLDESHKGPAAVYMKKVSSATDSNNAAGDGWFKIWESVYDSENDKWGTTKMIENNGHISVRVPEDIEGGYYLVRTELLALHAATANPPDPQFYVGCAQVFIESNVTNPSRPETVFIGEGTYTLDNPALTFNIYDKPMALPYPPLGPPVYKPKSNPDTTEGNSQEQTEGLKPEGCIFVNGNWCGFEVPSYNNEEECWAASDDCWRQSDNCWAETQPTGYGYCTEWSKKCEEISDSCKNSRFPGPPNAGQDITPEWKKLEEGGTEIFY